MTSLCRAVLAFWRTSSSLCAATELVAGTGVSAELRSYFEEVLWTALSLAREFGGVAELADTVGWCRPAAPEAAPAAQHDGRP